jgi:DNA-binding beta-propeller fold protein YncE
MPQPESTPIDRSEQVAGGGRRRPPAGLLLVAIATVAAGAWYLIGSRGPIEHEVWSLDQGTDRIHVYDGDHQQVAVIDVSPAALRTVDPEFAPESGRTVPHMIDFDSEHRFAFVAATAGGATIVIDAVERSVVAVLRTGPGTHMAAVTPADEAVWVAVIGAKRLVEIPLDLAEDVPVFEIGRVVDLEPLLAKTGFTYPSASPVCHDYDRQGRAWVTLGPGMDKGGLIVFDTHSAEIVQAFDPGVVRANCGIGFTADGRRAIANWSGIFGAEIEDGEGEWYVFDTSSFELLDARSSGGVDAHGVRRTPDGREFWQVNRGTGDGLRIDARSFEVTGNLQLGDAPDILDFSPDGRFAYVTQRGPNPLSGDPHVSKGSAPGVLVVDVSTGAVLRRLDPTTVRDADGRILNDVHGIGVRRRSGGERVVVAAPVLFLASPVGSIGCHLPT